MDSIDKMEARIARLEAREARLRARIRRLKFAAAGALALGTLIGFVRVALAGPMCMQTLPAPLVTLCAGAPALAADVNGNFGTLATNLVGKVGPFGSNDATMNNVAMKSATVSGGVTVNSTATVNGLLTANAGATVTGDVKVSGKVLVGYHSVTCNPPMNGNLCNCQAGEVALGGGGYCAVNIGIKNSTQWVAGGVVGWFLECTSGLPTQVNVVCARLGN